LHAKGICHRDIKPDNILCDLNTLEIKIVDFGISKKFTKKVSFRKNDKSEMWTDTGTLKFKAPEMFL
jgi:serine/threonine protein kinase